MRVKMWIVGKVWVDIFEKSIYPYSHIGLYNSLRCEEHAAFLSVFADGRAAFSI
jgi:hypothetical protein